MSVSFVIAWSFSNMISLGISVVTVAAILFPGAFGNDFFVIPRKAKSSFIGIHAINIIFQGVVIADAIVKQNDLYTDPPSFIDQALQYWKSTFLGIHIMCIELGDYFILSQYSVFDSRLLTPERLFKNGFTNPIPMVLKA